MRAFGRTWRTIMARATRPGSRAASDVALVADGGGRARASRAYHGHQVTAIATVACERSAAAPRPAPRQQQRGEGQEDVGDPHDDRPDPAARVAGDQAERDAHGRRPPARTRRCSREVRAPYSTRVSTSRPTWSVPNQCAPLGREQVATDWWRSRLLRVRRDPRRQDAAQTTMTAPSDGPRRRAAGSVERRRTPAIDGVRRAGSRISPIVALIERTRGSITAWTRSTSRLRKT